ncbi:Transmembrane channel-like protein 5, partial [Orchesella cincta]
MESRVSGLAKMDNFKSIVCAWDFSCTDTRASINLHKTIRRELHILARAARGGKNIIEIEAEQKRVLSYTLKKFGVRWGPIILHIISNLLLLVCCFLLGIVLYFLCRFKLDYYLNCISMRDDGLLRVIAFNSLCPNGDTYLQTWIFSLPAVFASLTTLALTRVIIFMGENEFWETTEIKVFVTMIRAGVFYLTNIGVFYLFWLTSKDIIQSEGFVAETLFGKELYRLVVIQGLADLFFNLGVKGLYHLVRRRSKGYEPSEFSTEYYSLSMFFMHSISIIGILFCPGICFFVTVRLVVTFYHHKFALLHLSSQETYSAHASSVYAPYLLTYFVCYLLTSFLNVYYISETKPSSLDGPFIDYSSISYDRVIAVVLTGDKTNWLKHLAQAGFLLTFIIILGSLVYFCREWSHAYEPIIQQLHEFILLERGDRDLLLKAIFDIGKASGVTFGASTTVSGTSTDVGESGEEEKLMEDQINRLIRHVQARESENADEVTMDRKTLLWNAARHHREHMERMVATIVQSKRKSRHSQMILASLAPSIRKKGFRRESSHSSRSGSTDTEHHKTPKNQSKEKDKQSRS